MKKWKKKKIWTQSQASQELPDILHLTDPVLIHITVLIIPASIAGRMVPELHAVLVPPIVAVGLVFPPEPAAQGGSFSTWSLAGLARELRMCSVFLTLFPWRFRLPIATGLPLPRRSARSSTPCHWKWCCWCRSDKRKEAQSRWWSCKSWQAAG